MLAPAWYPVSKLVCPDCRVLLQAKEVEINAELGIRLHFHCEQCGDFISEQTIMNLMMVCNKQDLRRERLRAGGLIPRSVIQQADQMFLHSVGAHLGPDIRVKSPR
jgi:hypothetical protein